MNGYPFSFCYHLTLFPFAFRLVFSQSLLSLDLIEDFLNYIDGTAQDEENKQVCMKKGRHGAV